MYVFVCKCPWRAGNTLNIVLFFDLQKICMICQIFSEIFFNYVFCAKNGKRNSKSECSRGDKHKGDNGSTNGKLNKYWKVNKDS